MGGAGPGAGWARPGRRFPGGTPESQDVSPGRAAIPSESPPRCHSALAALAVGPIPDFAPLAGVVAHVLARDLSQDMVNRLYDRLGSRFHLASHGHSGPRGFTDSTLAWMRDYQPVFVKGSEGQARAMKFLSENPFRQNWVGDTWVPAPGPTVRHRLFRNPGESTGGRWLETMFAPLNHQGGNQVATGRHVFVGERLLQDNAQPGTREMAAAGYRPRAAQEVVAELATALDVRPDGVVVLPWMPGEKTGHVDMYLMALGPDRVMIPEIRPEALEAVGHGHEKELGRQVQSFLQDRAEQLRGLGYKVARLPMLAPVNLVAAPSGGWHGVFYSPANGILANVPEGRQVHLPSFQAAGFPDSYRDLEKSYREEWAAFFQEAGWTPEFADATRLGQAHGLFRCLTEPIPILD